MMLPVVRHQARVLAPLRPFLMGQRLDADHADFHFLEEDWKYHMAVLGGTVASSLCLILSERLLPGSGKIRPPAEVQIEDEAGQGGEGRQCSDDGCDDGGHPAQARDSDF